MAAIFDNFAIYTYIGFSPSSTVISLSIILSSLNKTCLVQFSNLKH
jgi:hypothetical protein